MYNFINSHAKYTTKVQGHFTIYWSTLVKGKDKFAPLHTMKACRGGRGITPLILNLDTR